MAIPPLTHELTLRSHPHVPLTIRASVSLAILALLGSCSGGSSIDSGVSMQMIDQRDYAASTAADGTILFSFEIPAGSHALQTIAQTPTGVLIPLSLRVGSRELLPQSSYTTAQSNRNPSKNLSVNAPYIDGPLPGAQGSVAFRYSPAGAGATVQLSVLSKRDADPTRGTLRLNLINVGPTANSQELRSDLEGVLNVVKQIYARVGISIDPQWYDFAGPRVVPDPRTGAELYRTISSAVRPYSVNVVLAARVDGLRSDDRYGIAGAVPGPAVASDVSAVVIDLIEVTGGDGAFQNDEDDRNDRPSRHNDEIRLAAEEISRLVGNYLGLEPIVVFSGSRVVASDSLPDTESCLTEEACEGLERARSNVMMPRPLRERDNNGRRRFHARDSFSELQRRILNTHVLVD